MSSFPKIFAPDSNTNDSDSDWKQVPEKSKLKKPKSKAAFLEKLKISSGSSDPVKIPAVSSESVKPTPDSSESLLDETTSTASGGTKSNRSREPRKAPAGINVKLGPEWKKLVRSLLPNSLAGGKSVRDETILDEIVNIKRNSQVSNFEFKKIVCMFLHQAIKTDRHTLIERIIKLWNVAGYNMIELIDSIYDGCSPMTQACWSGSMFSIRTIVSADPTGQILSTVHPTKGETILETLAKGKQFALEKDPQSAVFIVDKFNKCEDYIRDAILAVETRAASAAADSECKSSHNPKIIEEIELIKLDNDNIVTELSLKLIDLLAGDNGQSAMSEYLGAIKTIMDKEIVKQIETNLTNEGIDLV
jgi:hypothetical protein